MASLTLRRVKVLKNRSVSGEIGIIGVHELGSSTNRSFSWFPEIAHEAYLINIRDKGGGLGFRFQGLVGEKRGG